MTSSPAGPAAPTIRVSNLQKHFGPVKVLRGISFDLSRGQVLVLIGPSGSGKTTLLRCLARLEVPDSGEIWVDGVRLDHHRTNIRQVRAEVGIIGESPKGVSVRCSRI